MGWCSGSLIAEDLWNEIKDDIEPRRRRHVALRIVKIFSDEDADCWDDDMNVIKDSGGL